VQNRIRQNHVERAGIGPFFDAADRESDLRQQPAGGRDHVGRTVEAANRSIGKTGRQDFG
jgi:hypothetical protein